MSRRRSTAKREIIPDYKYNSIVVTKFVNSLMERGKKALAQRILYSAIDFLAEKTSKNDIFPAFFPIFPTFSGYFAIFIQSLR